MSDFAYPLHEECGVFGIYDRAGTEDVAAAAYSALYALQHRGQESCGIAVNDDGVINGHRDLGLVNEVFTPAVLASLANPNAHMATGHVRYATAGSRVRANAQPMIVRHGRGTMALCHNGNLTNAIELRRQLENERDLHTIQSVFQSRESQPAAPAGRQEVWRRRIQYILSQLGMAGEKGAGDIMELCLFLLERKQTASQIGVGTLCSQLSDRPKTMEQRVRRAVERGLGHIASLGVEDYGNEFFTQYAAVLFPFPEVRAEMAHLRGKGGRGKVNLKKFLDGMLILTEEY